MKGLRIKQLPGESFIDLEPVDDALETDYLKLEINGWSSKGNMTSSILLDLEQTSKLFNYLKNYLDEKQELLEKYRENVKQVELVLRNVYKDARNSKLVTLNHIKSLSNIKAPIVALLAKDLQVPAYEIPMIIENNPLPFALLKKHYRTCWESLLSVPYPMDLEI